MKRSPAIAFAAVLIAAFTLGACGSSSKSSSSGYAETSAHTTSSPANAAGATTVNITVVNAGGSLGNILAAGPEKHAVYLFEADHGSTSACSGACAQSWPPVTTTGAPSAGAGANAALLGTITRPDGTKQVTYNGHPLYFFAGDSSSGEAKGQGSTAFGAGWYVLAPSGSKIDAS
jgi:predicted lipoprotein with Yx(FWY)xxD motif